MQLNHERPDYDFVLRAADARSARVNEQLLERSFVIAPDQLLADWDAPSSAKGLEPAHLGPVLELKPELVILGTGEQQAFPPAALAAWFARGVEIEAMDNAAAARTYSVLAGEGRRVVMAMLLG